MAAATVAAPASMAPWKATAAATCRPCASADWWISNLRRRDGQQGDRSLVDLSSACWGLNTTASGHVVGPHQPDVPARRRQPVVNRCARGIETLVRSPVTPLVGIDSTHSKRMTVLIALAVGERDLALCPERSRDSPRAY